MRAIKSVNALVAAVASSLALVGGASRVRAPGPLGDLAHFYEGGTKTTHEPGLHVGTGHGNDSPYGGDGGDEVPGASRDPGRGANAYSCVTETETGCEG
jgi:hypothetical protein